MRAVGVLVSGAGTNLQALLDAERAGHLAPGHVACVISSRAGVAALDRARAHDCPATVIDPKAYATREVFEDALVAELDRHGVEVVVLAGFMRVLTPHFLLRYPARVLNVHPSLLPAFPGLKAHEQALDHGVKVAGATVHLVEPEVDTGAIVLQGTVSVEPGDDAARLLARIHEVEHQLLPRAVSLLCAGRLLLDGRRVTIKD
ncbi:MAG: phosphoribosylglycinamide formyltransferase [Myxococcales bacterium]|nr:phosphoribosylglycinamide formyltransferase [Myxococcales bacterium]